MTKKEIRSQYLKYRSALTPAELEAKSLAIANQCVLLPIWEHTTFHLFLPIAGKSEVNTEYLLQVLFGRDKDVVVSKTDFGTGSMKHFLLTEETILRPGPFGIPEPDGGLPLEAGQIDVVFAPLLAFDLKGHRVGYGKGFYDRFLSECRPDVVKVGLSFFEPVQEILDVHDGDIRMDFGVTPERIIRF
jgi:5-formyltetrahydrofolate cyclo-ligase